MEFTIKEWQKIKEALGTQSAEYGDEEAEVIQEKVREIIKAREDDRQEFEY